MQATSVNSCPETYPKTKAKTEEKSFSVETTLGTSRITLPKSEPCAIHTYKPYAHRNDLVATRVAYVEAFYTEGLKIRVAFTSCSVSEENKPFIHRTVDDLVAFLTSGTGDMRLPYGKTQDAIKAHICPVTAIKPELEDEDLQ